MSMGEKIGDRVTLSAFCLSLGLEFGSMRAAADKLGVDHAYLSRLANGENENPSDEFLMRIGLRAERHVVYFRAR